MKLRLAVTAGLVVGLAGCTNQLAKEGTADAVLRIADVNGGSALRSDVWDGPLGVTGGAPAVPGTVQADEAAVTLAARSKNIRFNTTQYTRAFFVERYEVRYYRSDGRNVEGVDVPYRIAGDLSTAVDIGEPDKNVTIPIEVVRAQAKLEPPLRNLRGNENGAPGSGGGAIVLTCFAEITIYARQVASGDVVSTKGTLQIDFSDYITE